MSVEQARRENEVLRMRVMEKTPDPEAEEQALHRDNIRMKRKLGEEVTTEEVMKSRGVKVTTAREWHEGKQGE